MSRSTKSSRFAVIKTLAGLGLAAMLNLVSPLAAQAGPAFEVQVIAPKSGVSNAPDLIFIPGLASSREVWFGLLDPLCEVRRCHLLQLAGFAGTPRIEGDLLVQSLAQLQGYISAQQFKQKPVVIGHSLGGFLALKLASGPNSPVAKALVVDALPAFGAMQQPALTPEQLRLMASQMQAQMKAQEPADFAAQQQEALARMVTSPADLALVRDAAARSDRSAVIDAMAELFSEDLRPSLPAIERPVLVLGSWAAYKPFADKVAIEAIFRLQYQGLKGVQIEMAPDGLHFLMLDQRDWMLAQFERFLR
jgi:pimeloyl-ACP methyl ester carboxylesterase